MKELTLPVSLQVSAEHEVIEGRIEAAAVVLAVVEGEACMMPSVSWFVVRLGTWLWANGLKTKLGTR
ncbi:MAG: hypothetical protein WKF75_18355 [Singulisphaera sp.]